MTKYLVKRTGKLLFPHLARDQRKRRMSLILLIATICLFSNGILTIWMMKSHINVSHVAMSSDISSLIK